MTIGLDIETTGLNPWEGKCLLLTYMPEDSNKIVHIKGNARDEIEKLRPMLEDPTITKIIHRSEFDATWIAVEYGIFIQNIYDSKLMEIIIQGQGEYGKSSLKDCLIKYKLAKLNKETVKTFIGQKDYEFTPEQIHYAAEDVVHLPKLKAKQEKIIKKMGLELVAQLENKVAEVTYRMRVTGINFDRSKWLKIADGYEATYNKIEDELDKHFKNKVTEIKSKQAKIFEEVVQDTETKIGTKWTSPAQVKKLFNIESYDDLKPGKDPWLNKFIQMHNIEKFITTYGSGWLQNEWGNTIASDGRVHTSFNQIVSTGRYSSSHPNLQNVTKRDKEFKKTEHRSCFIPSDGMVLVGGDFTGQEIGIMAYGSGEPVWLDAIRNGVDTHQLMAEKLGGIHRDHAKNINFGLPYGKGAEALAGELEWDIEETARVIRDHKKQLPTLMKWLKHNGEQAIANSEIWTLPPFSRYRNLSLAKENWQKRNQGFNTPVQGTGADIIKLALWYVHKEVGKFGARILLCIHDEILTEIEKAKAKLWAPVFKDAMERAADYVTEKGLIKVDVKIKEHW